MTREKNVTKRGEARCKGDSAQCPSRWQRRQWSGAAEETVERRGNGKGRDIEGEGPGTKGQELPHHTARYAVSVASASSGCGQGRCGSRVRPSEALVEGGRKVDGREAPHTYNTTNMQHHKHTRRARGIPRVPSIGGVVEGARLKGVGRIHVCSHAAEEDHCTHVTVERRPVHCCPVHACSVPVLCLSFAPPMHHTR